MGHLGRILGRLGHALARLETVLGRYGSLEAVLDALSPTRRGARAAENRSGLTLAAVSELCENAKKCGKENEGSFAGDRYESAGGRRGD